jgi:hypothetical protein
LLQGNIGPADLMNLSFFLHLKALESCQTSQVGGSSCPVMPKRNDVAFGKRARWVIAFAQSVGILNARSRPRGFVVSAFLSGGTCFGLNHANLQGFIADCGLSGRISSGKGIRNPQSEIRNGDRDLTPRHRYQDNVSPLPENQVAHDSCGQEDFFRALHPAARV